MTLLTTFAIPPISFGNMVAPRELALSDLTIVVPVKNNQIGVTRLLEACLKIFSPKHCPAEIVLVDNLSHPPVEVPAHLASSLPVRVLLCTQSGAAAARNLGARQAQTRWILFLDSDCLPTPGLIDGYRQALNGAIAYAGMVRAEQHDPVSRYYDTQGILNPPPLWDDGEKRPAYLITANALVWREALAQLGGFDEGFPYIGDLSPIAHCLLFSFPCSPYDHDTWQKCQQMRQRGRIFRLSQVYFLLRVEHALIAREAM